MINEKNSDNPIQIPKKQNIYLYIVKSPYRTEIYPYREYQPALQAMRNRMNELFLINKITKKEQKEHINQYLTQYRYELPLNENKEKETGCILIKKIL